MKKSFAILSGFFALALLDTMLAFTFPVDFQYQSLSVIWHFYFIAVLVFTWDKPWLTRVLAGALCGIVFDLFFTNTFPFCFLMYPLFAFLAGLAGRWMDKPFTAFMVYMASCFLLDWIPYAWQAWTGIVNISFARWLYHMELITTLTNGMAVILIMYIDIVMVRFFLIQKHLDRREAKRKYSRMKRKTGNQPV